MGRTNGFGWAVIVEGDVISAMNLRIGINEGTKLLGHFLFGTTADDFANGIKKNLETRFDDEATDGDTKEAFDIELRG